MALTDEQFYDLEGFAERQSYNERFDDPFDADVFRIEPAENGNRELKVFLELLKLNRHSKN